MVRCTLIAAVARAFQPGCKVDTVLVLQGKQAFQKSTFFNVLAGVDWFDDSFTNSDKDEILKLHRTWIVEWAELETVFKRKDVSRVKAFITTRVDKIRPPYSRGIKEFKRPSIFVASTNEEEFLADATGSRRFWVVPVKNRIDIGLLKEERDQIWGAAVAAYRSGERWYLSDEESAQAENLSLDHQISDPWEEPIIDHIRNWDANTNPPITTTDILNTVIHLDLHQQDRSAQMRVAAILKRLGGERKRKFMSKGSFYFWEFSDLGRWGERVELETNDSKDSQPLLPTLLPTLPPNLQNGGESQNSATLLTLLPTYPLFRKNKKPRRSKSPNRRCGFDGWA